MSKRKAGKGPALGPKPKQTRVTLPLYPDLDEDLDGVQITPVSRNRSSSKTNKQGGKTSKARSKSAPPPTTEHSSDGDDDDDFVNTGNDSINLIDVEDEEDDVPDTLPHDSEKTPYTPAGS